MAVDPFTFRGSDGSLETLAEGLTAELNTGLSRFSYLRVIAAGSSDKAARYVIGGSIRQAGSRLRVTVQLHDRTTETQLWVETYERAFDPDTIFDLQDDLVPRIVSTCADPFGVSASKHRRCRPRHESPEGGLRTKRSFTSSGTTSG